jgi:hypothetical protein
MRLVIAFHEPTFMNPLPTGPSSLRLNARAWQMAISIVAGCALASAAMAQSLTLNPSAPTDFVIASQTTALGPGVQDGVRNFTDNGGPVGQTFTPVTDALVQSVSVLGRGNAASGWTDGPQPFDGNQAFGLLIGEVDSETGQLLNTTLEVVTGLVAPTDITEWLTFTLGTPFSVLEGTLYGFSLAQWSATGGMGVNGGWFGLAHSDVDVYEGGYAFNFNVSLDSPAGNMGNDRFGFFNEPGFAAPHPLNYDYAFVVQAVPEPGMLALLSLGGLALFAASRARRKLI